MGVQKTNAGNDYSFSLLKIGESDLEIIEDFEYGRSSDQPHTGPQSIQMYKNQFLIVSGFVEDTNYSSDWPYGGFFVFDKNNMGSASVNSIRYGNNIDLWGGWIEHYFPYDFDIDQDNDFLVAVVSSSAKPTFFLSQRFVEGKIARSGDTHDVRVDKYTLNNANGQLTFSQNLGIDVDQVDSCETVSIYSDKFYVICGFFYD